MKHALFIVIVILVSCNQKKEVEEKQLTICDCYHTFEKITSNNEIISSDIEDVKKLYKKYGVDYEECQKLSEVKTEEDKNRIRDEMINCK